MSDTSMNHRTGLDRSQTLLFPERLEDYIAAVDSQGRHQREHGADGGAAGEVQVAEDLGRTSLWDHQTVVWVHALSAQGTGESTDGMEVYPEGLRG